MLTALSPIDGRYASKTKKLQTYFSEYALIKYRMRVEVAYFKALYSLPLPQLAGISEEKLKALTEWAAQFSEAEAQQVKNIERQTNHDVKAVEYRLKEQLDAMGLFAYKEFVHFGLTSQDVNNTAQPLMMKEALEQVFIPQLQQTLDSLQLLATEWAAIPLLARTHGQAASPTRLGKELQVFVARLQLQASQLSAIPHAAKFGGATGNFNAHLVAYPNIDWPTFADQFVQSLGLERSQPTTQIEHYDCLAAQCHALLRINTILIDLCRDVWTYISMDYFRQRVVAGEVGSSAMPHKVNPIDFENAEGNLGLANALYGHLAEKLPISRLQRDLTDSTVMRNLGIPIAHSLIALTSIQKGLGKLLLNENKIHADLEKHWAVVAEGIQSILRRENYPQPYEALKAFTRGKGALQQADFLTFIEQLDIAESVKAELRQISPFNYLGL